jgi:single-strand DNA-binding protein
MSSFNKIILLGNLTRDPVLSYLPSQTAVINFGLATNRKWTGQDGQKKEEVCFVDCKAFGKLAENINKYCKKGNPLLIEGRLNFNQWEKEGVKHSKHDVVVESMQLMGGKAGSQAKAAPDEPQSNTQEQPGEDF